MLVYTEKNEVLQITSGPCCGCLTKPETTLTDSHKYFELSPYPSNLKAQPIMSHSHKHCGE